MAKTKKIYIVSAVISILIIVAIGINIYTSASKNYLCTIGDEKVSKSEFLFFLEGVKRDMLTLAQQASPSTQIDPAAFWATTIDGKNAGEVAKERALQNIRDIKVQLIMAKKNNITLTPSELLSIDTDIQDLISKSGEEYVEAQLFQYGMDINGLKEIYKQDRIINKLYRNQTAGILVSGEDIKNYYDRNPASFTVSPNEKSVWVRHILIKTVDAAGNELPKPALDEATKRAQDILARVKSGEDFAKLASELTEDTGSKENGGQYVFRPGEMVKEFEEASFALKPGEISGLVKTQYGFHIIKCEEQIPAGKPISFECARQYLGLGEDDVKSEIYAKEREEWKKEYPVSDINKALYDSIIVS